MRAILIATGQTNYLSPIDERYPTPLLQLVDRPFIQHIVEYLVRQGITGFDFILHTLPYKLEQFLGNGERWGCRFSFHLAKDPARLYDSFRYLNFSKNEPVVVAHADRLPQIRLDDVAGFDVNQPCLIDCFQGNEDSPSLYWTGWAVVDGEMLQSMPDGLTEDQFGSYLRSLGSQNLSSIKTSECLSVATYNDLLISNQKVITRQFQGLFLSGQEIEDGIWLSRNVAMHPTVKLTPPVYIGEDCRIERGCQIGPNTIIGSHCVVDTKSRIQHALIFPGSYVGCGLEIQNSIVDKNCLVNLDIGAALVVADEFILANLHERKFHSFLMKLISRTSGVLALIATSPLILLTVLYQKMTRGAILFQKEVLRLPASPDKEQWKTFPLIRFGEKTPTGFVCDFLLRFLPGLFHVAKGELSFVGVPPRTPSEVEELPSDWKHLYLESKPGLITEALVSFGLQVSDDDKYSAETFYAVSTGLRHDMRLLWRYICLLLGIIKLDR